MMNKSISKKMLLIAGAALILGVLILAVFLISGTNAQADEEYFIPELRDGKYYLNGDKEAAVYVLVENGCIQMCGEEEAVKAEIKRTFDRFGDGTSEEWIEEAAQYEMLPQKYHITPTFGKDISSGWDNVYMVMNSFTEPDENGYAAGTGYKYNGVDTISYYGIYVYGE